MRMKRVLIFIVLFFLKIFTIKCENRKVRLYLFFDGSLYRYFSEKNQAYKDFQSINDINELNTDYVIKDNILDLKEIDEKIKNKQIIAKGSHTDDFYDYAENINNYKITSLRFLSDNDRKGFKLRFEQELIKNFHKYEIKDLNTKVKIPDNVNFVYIFIDDFSESNLFKKITIKHLLLHDNNNTKSEKEDFKDIDDIINVGDLYKNSEYIVKYNNIENGQLLQILNDKLLNDDRYKELEFKFRDLTKKGDEKIKIGDLKKIGAFISDITLKDANYSDVFLEQPEDLDNNNMYLNCNIKFIRKVKFIFNIPENTELDLGLGMKQEAEIEFTSFYQEYIEIGLANAIKEIFSNKSILKNGNGFNSRFFINYGRIWPEKYIIKDENGNIIFTSGQDSYKYIDIMDKDNLTFEIYLKPGSILLKGIHVSLYFEPVSGKFVSTELEKKPRNNNIIGYKDCSYHVFLNKGENYIEQIKKILKDGYFNKQKISLDDDCYGLYLSKNSPTGEKEFIKLTNDDQLKYDHSVYILFNNNAIGKYIKDNENDTDPIYYGKDKDVGRDNKKFDPDYEYSYDYNYRPVTGNFENYYKYFNKSNSQVQYITRGDNSKDSNPSHKPIITPPKEINNGKCGCNNCMKCCCCKSKT